MSLFSFLEKECISVKEVNRILNEKGVAEKYKGDAGQN